MTRKHDLVFWQNAPSVHQAPFIRALSNDMGKKVLVVTDGDVGGRRRSMGWENVDYGSAEVHIQPSLETRRGLVEEARGAIANTFSGIGVYEGVSAAHRALVRGPHNHVAVFSESWDPRGVRGVGRGLRFRLRLWRGRKMVDSFFTFGDTAARQFRNLGVSASAIVPFGYSVALDGHAARESSKEFQLAFVGDLEEWKNINTLVSALAIVGKTGWHLTVVGDGSKKAELAEKLDAHDFTDSVTLIDRLPNRLVHKQLRQSDLLVLPSWYDGWGAVVNEALGLGTPAAVSRNAGSSSLIMSGLQGFTFDPADAMGLAAELRDRMSAGSQSLERRDALVNWASRRISPLVFAEYFWRRVDSGAAVDSPPWHEEAP